MTDKDVITELRACLDATAAFSADRGRAVVVDAIAEIERLYTTNTRFGDVIASQAAEIAALKADLLDASDAHLWIRKNRELAAEVERLKRNDDSYRDIANQSRLNINRLSVLADAQAAEIERLRKQHGLWHETSIPQLYAENASQAAEIERLRETHLLQLAGISTAAMGYHKASDSIHPDFKTTALDDVMELYAKYDALFQAALRGDKP